MTGADKGGKKKLAMSAQAVTVRPGFINGRRSS